MHLFESDYISIIVYLASWILFWLGLVVLRRSKPSNSISKVSCYFVDLSQKFFLVSFNMVIVDVLFYGTRTLFHAQKVNFFQTASAGALSLLVLLQASFIYGFASKLVGSNSKLANIFP